MSETDEAVRLLRAEAVPLTGAPEDLDGALALVHADTRAVLIGDATHGTHEFYRLRNELTKRLIVEHGFHGVVLEADWPSAYQVNRYVKGEGRAQTATEALAGFQAFPQWLWRNADVLDFVGWLRRYNDAARVAPSVPGQARGHHLVGLYGMDLYSLYPSIAAVLGFLLRTGQRDLYERARERYANFYRLSTEADPLLYGALATYLGSSERQALDELHDLIELSTNQRRTAKPLSPSGASFSGDSSDSSNSSSSSSSLGGGGAGAVDAVDARALETDDMFVAEQNARVVASAEEYYRTIFGPEALAWNVRERHMANTVAALLDHLQGTAPARVVVWAHSSHVGDARATSMAEHGEVNVGQLCRERFGPQAVTILGLTTSTGTVTAAPVWDATARVIPLQPPAAGSWEAACRRVGLPKFFVDLQHASPPLRAALSLPRPQRAIGAVYGPSESSDAAKAQDGHVYVIDQPDSELADVQGGHVYDARLAGQFDGLFYVDITRAVETLEPAAAVFTAATDLLAGL